ncbi:hypothetical protein DAEQUDRAFT_374708 [Daedalea quercina L-15889]|uniref:F-box domain-containing protein n=1 Tax=Daedalea quercina L-15889 TaxID=1314783 RepID=A0A165P777_9APHY|nr:hypothetical protein DAEQUDRAFT_374708 [Daedalea quercina L-15889]
MMNLASLHEDVLESVVSFLRFQDALRLSETCRSFHRVSLRRATSDVYISYPAQLERFCTFMLDDVQNRLQRLRRLEIIAQALEGNHTQEVHWAADRTCSDRVADVLEGVKTGCAAPCVFRQYTGGSAHWLGQSPDPDSRTIGKYVFHRTLRSEVSSLIPPARMTGVRDLVSIRVRRARGIAVHHPAENWLARHIFEKRREDIPKRTQRQPRGSCDDEKHH